ncbi:MAG: type II secretion system protein GspG [Verrucomicrobia bacterium]|nr:type II secretion system protein GspG [Verrucomicrobiota bacterium]
MNLKRDVLLTVVVVLSALLLIALLDIGMTARGQMRIARCSVQMTNVRGALQTYRTTYGNFPTGDVRRISAILGGENPRQILFLDTENANRSIPLIDPWKTPLRITYTSATNFTLESAGPNGKFGDADDLIR